MKFPLRKRIKVSELASYFGLPFTGEDVAVDAVAKLDLATAGCLTFRSKPLNPEATSYSPAVVITLPENSYPSRIISNNPRLDFAKIIQRLVDFGYFEEQEGGGKVAASAVIHPTASVGLGVSIGERTVIHPNVTIGPGVSIGADCIVKSGAVIGENGFGFERDLTGVPVRFPHLGSVRIGDFVEIGSLTTVCRGSLSHTIIEDYVKIDDHVHIAHNCHIGWGAMIVACAEISGSCIVGKRCWVAPQVSVKEGVRLGDDCFVGLGATVLHDVEAKTVVVGNPARLINKSGSLVR